MERAKDEKDDERGEAEPDAEGRGQGLSRGTLDARDGRGGAVLQHGAGRRRVGGVGGVVAGHSTFRFIDNSRDLTIGTRMKTAPARETAWMALSPSHGFHVGLMNSTL